MIGRPFAVVDIYFFGLGTGWMYLQPFQLVTGFLPPATQNDHLFIEDFGPVIGDLYLFAFGGTTDMRAGNICLAKDLLDRGWDQ